MNSVRSGIVRVLVVGSTGYLGRSVIRLLLERECDVVALGHTTQSSPWGNRVDYYQVDFTHSQDLAAVPTSPRIDAIINLAGPAPKVNYGWNADGVGTILAHVRPILGIREVFEGWCGRLIHASGMPVYGIPDQLPVNEAHPRKPHSMYGLAKLLSEDIALSWGGVDRWTLRLPGLFSSERRSGGLYNFMQAAARGETITITATEPTPWDILHVDDAANAIWQCLNSEFRDPGPVNIAYGNGVQLEAVATWIAELAGRGSRVRNQHHVQHPEFVMDISLARELIEWPPAGLYERLRDLYYEYGFEVG